MAITLIASFFDVYRFPLCSNFFSFWIKVLLIFNDNDFWIVLTCLKFSREIFEKIVFDDQVSTRSFQLFFFACSYLDSAETDEIFFFFDEVWHFWHESRVFS